MFRLFAVIAIFCTIETWSQCGACQYQTNLVTNGAFSSGNSGFTSELNYVTGIFTCPLCPENTYTIGANAIFYHSDFIGSDHTNPPTGNFFIANGQGQSGSNVWCQSISVQPYTDYVFTFWAQDVTNNNNPHPTALLQASFNGIIGSDTLDADGGWESLVVNWNSGAATTLDLCIVNQQSQTGGNDFGLDDISLVGCHNYQLSQQAFAGADDIVCSNEGIQLGQSPSPGYTYTWNNDIGLSADNISNPQFQLTNTSGQSIIQEYVLSIDSAGVGCLLTDTVQITVLSAPEFTLGPDQLICPGESTTLDAGPGWDDILWSSGATDPQIIAGSGAYWAAVVIDVCTYTDSVNIVEVDMPQIELGEDFEICESTPATLDANVVGLWSTGVTASSIVVNQTGNYSFTYTSGSCVVSDAVNVTVYTQPVITLPSDTTFCEGTTIILDAEAEGLWNNGVTASSIDIALPGFYSITIQNGPCVASAGTVAEMSLLPWAMLPEDTLICDGTYITIDTEFDQNDSYLWSTGDTTSSLTLNAAGVYEVNVYNECGSSSAECYVETLLCGWDIFIPNSFTPNEDGINDYWYTRSYNISNLKIFVYNRFGDLIFYTTNPEEVWNPSTGVGDDVYNYRIEAITFENEHITRLGHIYLLR